MMIKNRWSVAVLFATVALACRGFSKMFGGFSDCVGAFLSCSIDVVPDGGYALIVGEIDG